MIRYIKLQNYRSFTNISVDFTYKNNMPLNLIILYGANASGKSALISVFETLYDTIQTLNLQNAVLNILENNPDNESAREIHVSVKNKTNIKGIIQKNKTINSTDNMIIEIGFQCDKKNGSYIIEFNDERIVSEKLEYTLEKNKGVYYYVDSKAVKINEKIFKNFKNDLSIQIARFWGKHSVLSILNSASETYSDHYFENSVAPALLNVIKYLNSISVYITSYNEQRGILNYSNTLAPNKYPAGLLPLSEEYKLDNAEKALSEYFSRLYNDICGVFYERKYTEDNVVYRLYFKKIISGKECAIPYLEESCGTRNLMYIMPYLVYAVHGGIVAIDEIDNGIHDILLQKLLINTKKDLNGQIILTTHNILLLDVYSFKDSYYFIDVDNSGTRSIITPSQSDYRIQPNSNVIMNYLIGRFKGIPWENMNIDLKKIDIN